MKFDPQNRRQILSGSVISVFQETSYENASQKYALGTTGFATLNIALQCYLVGLFVDGRSLLDKARSLFSESIARREYEHPKRPALFDKLSLSEWLLSGDADASDLVRQVEYHERRFTAEQTHSDKLDIQLSLTPYLEAESYKLLIARYESAGLKKPANLRRIQGEGTMCYVMARHRLGMEYSDEEIAAALETFLNRSVKEWLGRYGAFSTAARWMKIAHWQPGDDPIATLLRCYDYLPDLKPPKYPPASVKKR